MSILEDIKAKKIHVGNVLRNLIESETAVFHIRELSQRLSLLSIVSYFKVGPS